MFVAGDPSLSLVLLTCIGGYLSAGGAGRRQPLVRPRHRRQHEAHRRPAGGLGPGGARARRSSTAWRSRRSPSRCSRSASTRSPRPSRCPASSATRSCTRCGSSARRPQNIVWGGAAGAVPPLVGWAAVTGSLSWTALYLFAIVFYWTPPHFWALSLLMKDDYAKAGVPMMPVVRGERETRRQILLYSLLLYAVTQLPFCAGGFGGIYLAASITPRRGLHRRRGAPLPPRRPPLGALALPVLARLPRAAVRGDGGGREAVGGAHAPRGAAHQGRRAAHPGAR